MSEMTLWIDGRQWRWDTSCWRAQLCGADVSVAGLATGREVEMMARIVGAGEWLSATLCTAEREWDYDGERWGVVMDGWRVEVMYNEISATWHAVAYGYGEARHNLGRMDLVAALVSAEQWADTLWGATIGRWSWDDEEAGAYVLRTGDALYTLYWGYGNARWWVEVAHEDTAHHICIPCLDARAAVDWIETEVIGYGAS